MQTLPDFTDELYAVLIDAGATEDELAAAPPATARRRQRRFRPLAVPDRHVADGERVDVPGWDIDAVWTPGHTPGHLCFHVPSERMLLSGDHVLPSITPHISISRRDRGGDPLGDFLDSLGKVAALDATEVLPAHRHRFGDLPGRVDAITRHHLDHLVDDRDDPRRRRRVAVADRGPSEVEPPVGAVPADAAPLGGERDRRAPALPDAAQPCRPPAGRAARSPSPCPKAPPADAVRRDR